MHVRPKKESMDELFLAILSLENLEECRAFFQDLCTRNELMAMHQRIIVARMLQRGKIYSHIVEATGASTATISRVNRALMDGRGGYASVLERMGQ